MFSQSFCLVKSEKADAGRRIFQRNFCEKFAGTRAAGTARKARCGKMFKLSFCGNACRR